MRWGQHLARAVGRRLSSTTQQRRIEQVDYRDAGHGYDVFGMHRDWLAAAQALAGPLYHRYFRVSSHGSEHIPAAGAAILVANHAGMLPLDAAMICMDVLSHTTPPRMVRCIGDRFLPELPFVGTLFSRCGVVSGTPANVQRLLENGELCLIFPEGLAAIGKPFDERYELHGWRVGHAELALQHDVPVIPVAVIGSEEQWPQIGRIRGIFNIPGRDTLPLSELIHRTGRVGVPLPGPLLAPLYRARTAVTAGRFRYDLDEMRFHYGAILDGRKAKALLGYVPQAAVLLATLFRPLQLQPENPA